MEVGEVSFYQGKECFVILDFSNFINRKTENYIIRYE